MSQYREWKAAVRAAKVHESAAARDDLQCALRKRFARLAGGELPSGVNLKRTKDGAHQLAPDPYAGVLINAMRDRL